MFVHGLEGCVAIMCVVVCSARDDEIDSRGGSSRLRVWIAEVRFAPVTTEGGGVEIACLLIPG